MSNSETVRLGEVGSLRTSISSHGHEEEKEVKNNSIKGNKVIFARYADQASIEEC